MRDVFAANMTSGSRLFVFIDSSYSYSEAPCWPVAHEKHELFLTHVHRMPASVRDPSVPFCRELAQTNEPQYFQLRDETVTRLRVQYYDSCEDCVNRLCEQSSGLLPEHVAILKVGKVRVRGSQQAGSVQNFVGLERPFVIVSNGPICEGTDQSSIDELYLSMTRCTYQLCIAGRYTEGEGLMGKFGRYLSAQRIADGVDSVPKPPKQAKKDKRVKDPNEPKRPISSFIFFCTARRAEYKEQHPGEAAITNTSLGEEWRSL